jgi:hypothetical protein
MLHLLVIGLRVLSLLECQVRKNLAAQEESQRELKELYKGQPQ